MNTSASSASVEAPQPATLLIVETDTVFREFEARTLSDRGHTFPEAGGTEEALKSAIGSAAIHLLLTEFPEFTRQSRTIPPTTPVLLVGALEPFDQGVHNLGRIGVMAKPFTLEELIIKAHRLLTKTAPLAYQRPEFAAPQSFRLCSATLLEETRFLNR